MCWQVAFISVIVVSVTAEVCDETLRTVRYHGPDDDIVISKSTAQLNQMPDFTDTGRRLISLLRNTYKKSLTSKNFPSTFQDRNRYIQVDLARPSLIRAIISRGCGQKVNADCGRHVTKYRLVYSLDGVEWQFYNAPGTQGNAIFVGDNGPTSSTRYQLGCPIVARYVRIFPITAHLPFYLTLDINGCFLSTDEKVSSTEKSTQGIVTNTGTSFTSSPPSASISFTSNTMDSTDTTVSSDQTVITELFTESSDSTVSPLTNRTYFTMKNTVTEFTNSKESKRTTNVDFTLSQRDNATSELPSVSIIPEHDVTTPREANVENMTRKSTMLPDETEGVTVNERPSLMTIQVTTANETTDLVTTPVTTANETTDLLTTPVTTANEMTNLVTTPVTTANEMTNLVTTPVTTANEKTNLVTTPITTANETTTPNTEGTTANEMTPPATPEHMTLADMTTAGHGNSTQHDSQENTIDPSPVNGCVEDCTGKPDGHYHSCKSCKLFVTCSNEILYDKRPCPSSLVWDDIRKQCCYHSKTCAVSHTQDAAKLQQLQHQQQKQQIFL